MNVISSSNGRHKDNKVQIRVTFNGFSEKELET